MTSTIFNTAGGAVSAGFCECSLMGVSRFSCLNTRFHAGRKLNFLEAANGHS
jgi:hypothetical protein